jgi:Sortilin, neurotensin receptor 3,
VQTVLQSELLKLTWSGPDDEWVWAITTGESDETSARFHHVYWSKDHGNTLRDRWDDLVAVVRAYRADSYDTDQDDLHASCNGIIVHARDPKKVLLWGDGLYSFATSDGGDSFKVSPVPENTLGLAHQVRVHPTQPDWLLSLAYRSVCYDYGTSGCAMDLFISKDFGGSWQNLTAATNGRLAGFIDFDWGYHDGQEKYRSMFSEQSIVATGHTHFYESMLEIPNTDLHLWRSDDDFETVEQLAHCGAAVELVAGQVVSPLLPSFSPAGRTACLASLAPVLPQPLATRSES